MSIDAPRVPDPAEAARPTTSLAERYRVALQKLPGTELAETLLGLGVQDRASRPRELANAVYDRLDDVRFLDEVIGRVGPGARRILGLFPLVDQPAWPWDGIEHAAAALGVPALSALEELFRHGLLAATREGEGQPKVILPHPTALQAARVLAPEGDPPPVAGPIRQVRESDGLEPMLRLAALWQRVDESALRRTQQGSLYKRDRERIEDDPVLGGPMADSLEPMPDMGHLWLALARRIGLVIDERGSDRTVAATAEFWSDNGVHLPQMIAVGWLGLRSWHEVGGIQAEGLSATLATPFLRPVVLLWLTRFEPDRWVAIEDLATHFDRIAPHWTATVLGDFPGGPPEARERTGRDATPTATPTRAGLDWLTSMLLGPAYQLGLVRAAEEDPSGRRVVQITALGRYVLAMGPPPPPRETFEDFLYIQPNFEVIAYRQGLNPVLIGQLSRFMTWSHSGAALEMRLTAESVYRGLEGGLTPEAMLARLTRHSARPLPSGVAEALRSWSSRRDRVTFFASATLVEFATPEALDEALKLWPSPSTSAPTRVAARLLLVEDESAIPFPKFRLAGSRDYRRPAETCVEVERDGVTLSIDLGRSDLFIDAELARMAEEIASDRTGGPAIRRFRITPLSLQNAVDDGLNQAALGRWFEQRVGTEMPPAVRLLLHAAAPDPEPPRLSRPLILTSPTVDLLDGLLQHPTTRDHLGDRLGPTTVIVPDEALERLRKALETFGLRLD